MIGSIVAFRYEVQTELASDGLFTIYKGMDTQRGRQVKIRTVHPLLAKEPEFLAELERVCEKHFRFQHPGLERVLDLYHAGEEFYVICDYDDGALLEDRLKRLSSFQVPAALTASISIVEALESCHSAGVIHGDISATNVFSKRTDGTTLMCAGYWEAFGASPYAARTAHLGMAPYLAPEVTAGSMPSTASDIYSTGVLIFRLLSGRYPYSAETPAALAQLHETALPPSLRRTNNAIPLALEHIILKCLAKHPADRYQSATSLLRDLRMVQDSQRFGRPVKGIAAPERVEPATPPTVVRVSADKARAMDQPSPKEPEAAKIRKGKEDGLPLWAAIIGYAGVLAVIITIAWWAYFSFARPDSKVVPNLVGQTEQEAVQKLSSIGLQMHRMERASDKPKGQVLEVSPEPGRLVKALFPVKVTVSAGSLFVETPDLRGRPLDEARQLLATIGLELSRDVQFSYDPQLGANMIMSQTPPAKEKIQRMSRVRVTVNTGIAGQEPSSDTPRWHRYRIEIPLPDKGTSEDLQVRVEMTDQDGTHILHEGAHRPGEVLGVKVNAEGGEIFFRVYVDGELWDQVSKAPPPPSPEDQ